MPRRKKHPAPAAGSGEAPAAPSSGSNPSDVAQQETGSKKRQLDEDAGGAPAASTASAGHGSKRRKTSKSPSNGSSGSAGKAAQSQPQTTATAGDPSSKDHVEGGLDFVIDTGKPTKKNRRSRAKKKKNQEQQQQQQQQQQEQQPGDSAAVEDESDDDPRPTRRVTRSMSGGSAQNGERARAVTRSMSSSSGQDASTASNAVSAASQGNQNLKTIVVKTQTYNVPSDPTLLEPIFEGESWECRAIRFHAAVCERNPDFGESIKLLWPIWLQYIKNLAWRSQADRGKKVKEAEVEFERLRKSAVLKDLAHKCVYQKDVFTYPPDPLLIAPLSLDEGFGSRLRRLCTALLEANKHHLDLISPIKLDSLIRLWPGQHAFRAKPDSKAQKQQTVSEIAAFRQTPPYTQLLTQCLNEARETQEEPAEIVQNGDDAASVGQEQDQEAEDETGEIAEDDTGEIAGDDTGEIAEDGDEMEEDAAAAEDGGNEQTGDGRSEVAQEEESLGADQSGATETQSQPAPTASEWASLLGPSSEDHAAEADLASRVSPEPPVVATSSADVQIPQRTIMDEAAMLKEQSAYFPGASASGPVCVVCACPGHDMTACPFATCKHCRGDHFTWSCPERRRCAKCKQYGHRAASCTEKLALTREEGLACAFCDSADHLENDCDVIWRSFHILRPEDRRTVRSIPAFCSLCGSDGHFSGDCGLHGDRRPNSTWTMANQSQFVDESSDQQAISAHSQVPEPLGPGAQIKGLSAKRTHIFYSDSDGSEEGEFLGGKVQPKAGPGQIRMATNIQFAPVNPPGYQGLPPPLPPGPPPPRPPPRNGGYSSLSHSHRLPPRPPAPGQPSFGQGQPPLPNYPPPPGLGMNGPGQSRQGRKRQDGPGGGGQAPGKRPRRGRGGY